MSILCHISSPQRKKINICSNYNNVPWVILDIGNLCSFLLLDFFVWLGKVSLCRQAGLELVVLPQPIRCYHPSTPKLFVLFPASLVSFIGVLVFPHTGFGFLDSPLLEMDGFLFSLVMSVLVLALG